jgi:predicted transcriptional regulator
MKTLIEIDDADVHALDEMASRQKVSRSALIRRAVGDFLAQNKGGDIEAAFGLWRDNKVDGLRYQRKLRSEW